MTSEDRDQPVEGAKPRPTELQDKLDEVKENPDEHVNPPAGGSETPLGPSADERPQGGGGPPGEKISGKSPESSGSI